MDRPSSASGLEGMETLAPVVGVGVLAPVAPGRAQVVPEGVTAVGRAAAPDGAAIVVADLSVSRRHARFEATGGAVRLTDLDSTNGTRLDGELLRAGVAVPLPRACVLSFGHVDFAWSASKPSDLREQVLAKWLLEGGDGVAAKVSSAYRRMREAVPAESQASGDVWLAGRTQGALSPSDVARLRKARNAHQHPESGLDVAEWRYRSLMEIVVGFLWSVDDAAVADYARRAGLPR